MHGGAPDRARLLKMERESSQPAGLLRRGLSLVHHVDSERRVCDRSTGPHLGGDPDRFHDLLTGRAFRLCAFGVAANAIWTLRHMGYSDRNELFRLGG